MGKEKEGQMAIRRIGPNRGLVGAQISRKDFLRIGGTGLAGAALLGTAGCGSVFGGGQSGGAVVVALAPPRSTSTSPPRYRTSTP
jgi:hypothetical protein